MDTKDKTLDYIRNQRWRSRSTSKISSNGFQDGCEEMSVDGKTKPRGWSVFNISVEPLLFCLTFNMTFSNGVLLNLLERNVCVQKFNLTWSDCTSSSYTNSSMKSYLEGEAAQVNVALQLMQGLCPVVMSLFIGPWSDKNGRKPFIMLPFAGFVLYYMLWAVISLFPQVPIRYLLIPSVPLSLTGSVVAVMVCCYCYLCDIFDSDNRTFRFNIGMSAFLAGGLLANLTVSLVFTAAGDYGYTLVFLVCSAVAALAFLYSWLCLQETIEKEKGKGFLFRWEFAESVLKAIYMRPLSELLVIIVTVAILVSEVLIKSGEGAVEYLVGKSQFSWTLNNFTLFSTYITLFAVTSSVLGSLIMKRVLGLENATIILTSSLVLTLAEVMRAFAHDEKMYWITSGLSKTGALIGPTIAAEMSNVVSTEDLGKVYAFNALIESGSAYISAPMFTSLYRYALSLGDCLHVYFLSAGISTVIILAAICLFFNNRRFKEDKYNVNKF